VSDDLMVTVKGELVALKECGWLHRKKCGCIVAAATAEQGPGEVLATADQFHKQMRPRKDSRAKDVRDGMTIELITMAYYREHIGAKWECPEHAPETAGAR
jgi:hypothetical protein